MSEFNPSNHTAAECVNEFLKELDADGDANDASDQGSCPSDEEAPQDHQPSSGDEEEAPADEEEFFVPTEAEKDKAARARAFAASSVPLPPPPKAGKGVKRPRDPAPGVLNDDVVPDLSEIFDNYDTPHKQRVSICRAYASYLSSMMPKAPKAPKKGGKK